jgi:hypothetical protein
MISIAQGRVPVRSSSWMRFDSRNAECSAVVAQYATTALECAFGQISTQKGRGRVSTNMNDIYNVRF